VPEYQESNSPRLPLTVIFVCYNNVDDLRSTYTSLNLAKNYINEIVIVDSSVGSEVKSFSEVIDETYKTFYKWEPAQGIYHAMNTGLMMANHESVIWYLNPGDVLVDATSLGNLLLKMTEQAAVWGFGQAEKDMKGNLEVFPTEKSNFQLEDLLFGSLSISHQSTFCIAKTLVLLGGFDERYQIASDLKMQIDLLQLYEPAVLFKPIVRIDPNGISHNRLLRSLIETIHIRFRCQDVSKLRVSWSIFKFLQSKIQKHRFMWKG
jgi:hypothetical protein